MSNSTGASGASLRTVRSGPMTVSASRRPRTVPELLRDGLAAHGSAMVVRALPAQAGDPRRAIVASRKVGGAVARNRAKRRLREALRAAGVPADLDLVIVARTTALSVPLPQLATEVGELVERIRTRLPDARGES